MLRRRRSLVEQYYHAVDFGDWKDEIPDDQLVRTLFQGMKECMAPGMFGGVILSHIDMAGSIGARRAVQLRGGNARAAFVTVALNRVEFKKPVLVGDVVSFGGLLGRAPVLALHRESSAKFVARGGRIPAPLQALGN